MTVIDGHVHLDGEGTADEAVAALVDELAAADIAGAIVLHLNFQRWSVEEVADALRPHRHLFGFVHVDPREADASDQLRRGIGELGYAGLKLHPRLLGHGVDDEATITLVGTAGELGVPVVVDAFPDGTWLLDGWDPRAFGRLARACPDTRIVAAHFGGHHCLDLMMIVKRSPNLWVDLSYSLLYFRGSSVVDDLVYACRSMRFERVFYGSDTPDRSIGASLELSLAELRRRGVGQADLERLLAGNVKELLGWTD